MPNVAKKWWCTACKRYWDDMTAHIASGCEERGLIPVEYEFKQNHPGRIATEYNPFVWIIGEPTIEEGVWIGPFTVIDASGGLRIGHHTTISAGAHIYTHRSGAGKGAPVDRAPVIIGSNVYVGPQSIITMGVVIGDRAWIGAQSLVRSHVPPGEAWWGTPAVKAGRYHLRCGPKVKWYYHGELPNGETTVRRAPGRPGGRKHEDL